MADNKEKFVRTHVEGMNKFNDSLNKQNNNGNKRKK
ncbi:hypothetical protein HER12_000687 [Spiroplasma platyhelix PALS-1]|nr:hypothetical protein [Spiroplasma platyhelix PALS-1]UJB29008.1 hypothetical protein SPLAT_v1c02440 [Spiroplasma platyhelix PALS-1]